MYAFRTFLFILVQKKKKRWVKSKEITSEFFCHKHLQKRCPLAVQTIVRSPWIHILILGTTGVLLIHGF